MALFRCSTSARVTRLRPSAASWRSASRTWSRTGANVGVVTFRARWISPRSRKWPRRTRSSRPAGDDASSSNSSWMVTFVQPVTERGQRGPDLSLGKHSARVVGGQRGDGSEQSPPRRALGDETTPLSSNLLDVEDRDRAVSVEHVRNGGSQAVEVTPPTRQQIKSILAIRDEGLVTTGGEGQQQNATSSGLNLRRNWVAPA